MTNGERADRLLAEAGLIAAEMRSAVQASAWNLALRRAQESLELAIKALLNEMGVDYPKTHDPVPVLASEIRQRHLHLDSGFLHQLGELSAGLARLRSPAFYQEIEVSEAQAGDAVRGVEQALAFAKGVLAELRRPRA